VSADNEGQTWPFGNDPAKVARYQAFWRRDDVARPLVGFSFKSWFPLQEFEASARWQQEDVLTPDMVDPEAFVDDQLRLLREGEELADDILRGASPSQAVPWLCAMLGNDLRILPGSILGVERVVPWETLERFVLEHDNVWLQAYLDFIDTLVRAADGRFPVSHGTLIGPTDMLGMVRGHGQSVLDIVDQSQRIKRLIARFGDIFRQVTEAAWERIPPFMGGTFDAQYQLWAPGPIARLQEDATALYSPRLYREFVQPVDIALADHFECAFMHLHSTSMFLLDAFLEIESLGCFEINHDVSGPPLATMVPCFQTVQAADRSLLIRGSFTVEEARMLMDSLDPHGLYIYVMVEEMAEVEALRPVLGL
jgi:hypothetical protein